jgi:hypothetical protein
MIPDHENRPLQAPHPFLQSNVVWRRVGETYVLVHAVVAVCTCSFGLGYLNVDWHKWIPAAVGVAVQWVGMLGLIPFVLSSPIIAFVMLFVLSYRDREWLYLGISEAAVLLLHIVGLIVACL